MIFFTKEPRNLPSKSPQNDDAIGKSQAWTFDKIGFELSPLDPLKHPASNWAVQMDAFQLYG